MQLIKKQRHVDTSYLQELSDWRQAQKHVPGLKLLGMGCGHRNFASLEFMTATLELKSLRKMLSCQSSSCFSSSKALILPEILSNTAPFDCQRSGHDSHSELNIDIAQLNKTFRDFLVLEQTILSFVSFGIEWFLLAISFSLISQISVIEACNQTGKLTSKQTIRSGLCI